MFLFECSKGRLVFYDDEKTFVNSVATAKESRERIEIIADKDLEKFEFTIEEEKYKVSISK